MDLKDLSLQRGAIPVELDRQRILFYDMPATWMLRQRFGPQFLTKLYAPRPETSNLIGVSGFELLSIDVLEFYLFAGLQAEARLRGEELTVEQVQSFIRPWSINHIFERVLFAVTGATATPAMLGKAEATGEAAKPAASAKAAAKRPASPGPTKVSASTKRSASLSRSSAGSRRSSGRQAR